MTAAQSTHLPYHEKWSRRRFFAATKIPAAPWGCISTARLVVRSDDTDQPVKPNSSTSSTNAASHTATEPCTAGGAASPPSKQWAVDDRAACTSQPVKAGLEAERRGEHGQPSLEKDSQALTSTAGCIPNAERPLLQDGNTAPPSAEDGAAARPHERRLLRRDWRRRRRHARRGGHRSPPLALRTASSLLARLGFLRAELTCLRSPEAPQGRRRADRRALADGEKENNGPAEHIGSTACSLLLHFFESFISVLRGSAARLTGRPHCSRGRKRDGSDPDCRAEPHSPSARLPNELGRPVAEGNLTVEQRMATTPARGNEQVFQGADSFTRSPQKRPWRAAAPCVSWHFSPTCRAFHSLPARLSVRYATEAK